MTDKMPTREQIAEALLDAYLAAPKRHMPTFGESADAVLALFPQPTPSVAAEDEWCREERCEYRHWVSGPLGTTHKRGSGCPAPSPAEPSSIADMAPGTHFSAARLADPKRILMHFEVTYANPTTVKRHGWESYEYVSHLDSSTIRDVTPPK